MRQCLFALLLLVVSCSTAFGQVATASWNQGNVASVTQANGFTYRQTITPVGGSALAPITLTGVSCTGTPPLVACTGSAGAAGVAALITGARSTLTATDTSGANPLESAPSIPFSPPASAPTGLKVGG